MFSVAAALLGVVLSLLLVWFVLERHKEQLEEEWLGRLNALKEEWEQNLRQTKEELEQKIRQKEAKWQKMDEVEWEWKKQMEAKQLEWEQESARSFERDFSVMVSAVSRYITEPNAQRRKDALAAIEPVRAVADGALDGGPARLDRGEEEGDAAAGMEPDKAEDSEVSTVRDVIQIHPNAAMI